MLNQDTRVEVKEKLIILYTYNSLNIPVPSAQVDEILLGQNLMDYFLLQQYTLDMTEKGLLELNDLDGETLIMITEQGISTLNFFKERLSAQQTLRIDEAVVEVKKALKRARLIRAEYTKLDDANFIVDLRIKDGDQDLVRLTLNVPTNKRAKRMTDQWKKDALTLYQNLITLFDEESEQSDDDTTL